MMLRWSSVLVAVLWIGWTEGAWAEVTAQRVEQGVVIKLDGQPFAEYRVLSGTKPIIWPIIGPTGSLMTRNYPMAEAPNERTDHPHQRSLWFTHGLVNGTDFWAEVGKSVYGSQKHREFVKVEGGREAVVVTRNDWIAPDGKPVCEDERTVVFGGDSQRRWIDFGLTIIANHGPVVFGDTKEGSFGIRVPETMKVDAKSGGRIINSDGLTDKDAWGKRATWVDYTGPVDGKNVGIAVLNHPSSFRFPCYWHVRTYGLFAANTFGEKDFTADKTAVKPPVKKGEKKAEPPAEKPIAVSYTLPAGESIKFRYRVLFHKGDEKEGRVAEAYAEFAK